MTTFTNRKNASVMTIYPYKFEPIYKDKIWGGRNLERLFERPLPVGLEIGESWELADLPEGTSLVSNGPDAGRTLTEITRDLGPELLGNARPMPDGRFPLLLKLLDANDILSLQVHPDEKAVREIGPGAALKTECWYVLESRQGFIYKGLNPGVTPDQFRRAIEQDRVADLCRRIDVRTGDFYYLPAGTVHALGAGVVVAEVQTPSDTTYRVSDWGRGREIHVEMSMKCIHFGPDSDESPGAQGNTLLATDYFTVSVRTAGMHEPKHLAQGQCSAIMITSAEGVVNICHEGPENVVSARQGDTLLLPAALKNPTIVSAGRTDYLEVTLPQK